MAPNKAVTQVEGFISQALPNAQFKVQLKDGKELICHLSGKMRLYKIKVMPGDNVKVEVTPYDETKGRIVYRG